MFIAPRFHRIPRVKSPFPTAQCQELQVVSTPAGPIFLLQKVLRICYEMLVTIDTLFVAPFCWLFSTFADFLRTGSSELQVIQRFVSIPNCCLEGTSVKDCPFTWGSPLDLGHGCMYIGGSGQRNELSRLRFRIERVVIMKRPAAARRPAKQPAKKSRTV